MKKKQINIFNIKFRTTSNCITNNYSKLKYISILQIINHNMSKKVDHNNYKFIYLGFGGILVKYHLIKWVILVKQFPWFEH